LVPPGSAVSFEQEGRPAVLPLTEATQASDERNTNVTNDLVLTPGGYRSRSRVHLIEPGHAVDVDGGQLGLVDLASGGRPGPPSNSNWISYAGWLNTTGQPITSFQTVWKV